MKVASSRKTGPGRAAVLLGMVAVLLLAGCAAGPPGDDRTRADGTDVRLATYNVHFLDLRDERKANWGPERWAKRRAPLAALLRSIDADVVAFQELETAGAATRAQNGRELWLLDALPGYRVAASRFGNGVDVGQPIFYRPDVFGLLDEGYALFSNPDARFRSIRAFSGYPDAVTWARLRQRESGRLITIFNVHFHFLDTAQRLRSAHRVLELADVAQARGDTVFVTGDFNARRNSRTLRIFRGGGFRLTPQNGASFHFNTGLHLYGAIDHMLHDTSVTPLGRSVTDRRKPGGVWPSDHYPIWTDFRLLP